MTVSQVNRQSAKGAIFNEDHGLPCLSSSLNDLIVSHCPPTLPRNGYNDFQVKFQIPITPFLLGPLNL